MRWGLAVARGGGWTAQLEKCSCHMLSAQGLQCAAVGLQLTPCDCTGGFRHDSLSRRGSSSGCWRHRACAAATSRGAAAQKRPVDPHAAVHTLARILTQAAAAQSSGPLVQARDSSAAGRAPLAPPLLRLNRQRKTPQQHRNSRRGQAPRPPVAARRPPSARHHDGRRLPELRVRHRACQGGRQSRGQADRRVPSGHLPRIQRVHHARCAPARGWRDRGGRAALVALVLDPAHSRVRRPLAGNVVDLAVAIVVGSSFTALVNALVADFITPFIAVAFDPNSVRRRRPLPLLAVPRRWSLAARPAVLLRGPAAPLAAHAQVFGDLTFTINGSIFRYEEAGGSEAAAKGGRPGSSAGCKSRSAPPATAAAPAPLPCVPAATDTS